MIGTTDRDYHGDPGAVTATSEEIDYLCQAASEYFRAPIARQDVVWSYSGVRPLYDDGASEAQAATRDYELVLDDKVGAPLLSVFGGKLTTYRRLAEHAIEKLAPHLPAGVSEKQGWSADFPLPGGDFPVEGFDDLVAKTRQAYPWLEPQHAQRLCRLYGTKARALLRNAQSFGALGRHFGATLTEAEIDYLMREEWAECAEDVVLRRTKLALRMTLEQIESLDDFMRDRRATADAA